MLSTRYVVLHFPGLCPSGRVTLLLQEGRGFDFRYTSLERNSICRCAPKHFKVESWGTLHLD